MSRVTPPQQPEDGSHPYLVRAGKDDEICWLEYLPKGRRVVSGSRDGTMRVWNLDSWEQEGALMEHKGGMTDLAVTRDGTKIISGDKEGGMKVWDVESRELVQEWSHPAGYPNIAISPDGRLVAVRGGSVAIYTIEGWSQIDPITIDGVVLSTCFSPDGNKLACGTYDEIHVYDIASGRLILGPLGRRSVRDLLWSRDGSRLFSGSDDGSICCWNSDTGVQIGHLWTGHTRGIRCLSLSPNGSILASASFDKTICFWDATTGNHIGQHLRRNGPVKAVRFSSSGESVASVGGDRKICFWRVPWLSSVESQVSTLIRCTSMFILIIVSI